MKNEPQIFTVSDLTRQIKNLVEANFPYVWVRGEISNCTKAASGHVYFTLKDESAQMRAVVWRNTAARLKFDIHDGLEVVAAGAVEIYLARGSYQLIVEELIPHGIGGLELAFRQLQEKLAAEGLFDPQHKRPLPRFPRRIALVTSPTSAAVRDMLQVITRRWPVVDIILLPVAVQGASAAEEIVAALQAVPAIPRVDVVITGRGGGSLEDLWAFNEEIVARAIHACPIPVVSAVGHEIDVSIADLVADRRALTPSEAGELVVPNRDEVVALIQHTREAMRNALRQQAAKARLQLDALAGRRIFARPLDRIGELTGQVDELCERLTRSIEQRVHSARRDAQTLSASLDALSPLRVLKRGYSITHRTATGVIVRVAQDVKLGDILSTLLSQGRIVSRVESIDPTTNPSAAAAEERS